MSVDHIYEFYQGRRYSSIVTPNPDPHLYPKYYKAKRFELTLNEGDQLFIPMGWFHHVFSETVDSTSNLNMALNFWKKTHHTEYDLSLKQVSLNSIPFYETMTSNHYSEHETRNEPFLTRSLSSFDLNEFMELYKDTMVYYKYSETPHFPSNHMIKDLHIEHSCTLNEFINFQKESGYYYLQQCHLPLHAYTPDYFPEVFETNLWLNFGDVNTMNHYDGYENILYQLKGTKRIYLFPPCERTHLYLYNPFDLQFILKTYEQLKHQTKNHPNQNTYIQYYDYALPNELCEKIIGYQRSNVQLHDLDPFLDQYVFERINTYIYAYIHSITTQFKPIDINQCQDNGYSVQQIDEETKEYRPAGHPILKYKWFLNDNTSTYVNDIEIKAKQGRLLIYPSHFTYYEYEEESVKNKWICYGYLYPRRDSNPQSYD